VSEEGERSAGEKSAERSAGRSTRELGAERRKDLTCAWRILL